MNNEKIYLMQSTPEVTTDNKADPVNLKKHKVAVKLSSILGKQAFCICENKAEDQLRGAAVTPQLISTFVSTT